MELLVHRASPKWIPATVLLRELRVLGYSGGISILKDHQAGGSGASINTIC